MPLEEKKIPIKGDGSLSKVRITDIAKRAGVSPGTVSNALNGRAGVSEPVLRQIRQLAEEMGYLRPHERTQGEKQYIRLVVFRSQGIVQMDAQFYSELLQRIQEECHKAHVELLVTHITPKSDPQYRQTIDEICREKSTGVLLLGTEMTEEETSLFENCESPLVVLDSLARTQRFHAVVVNNLQASAEAVAALYKAGFHRIGHITSRVTCSNVFDRRWGFEHEMTRCGLEVQPEDIWELTPTIEGAYEEAKAKLAEGCQLPEAFFSANDTMAVGVIRAVMEAGYRVPEDVSFIGMDDTAICQACTPTLTSMRVSRHDLSVAAIQMLLSVVPSIRSSPIKAEINAHLVVRESVKGLHEIREDGK